ncbi:phage minor head protein [Rudanella lutea]|uniref:phage minor head protein n=1 Tax=Rudanella lutea TaxID=451374 RepID=UPI00037CFB76|nr:phage minor head protein [Rudanella lutea]
MTPAQNDRESRQYVRWLLTMERRSTGYVRLWLRRVREAVIAYLEENGIMATLNNLERLVPAMDVRAMLGRIYRQVFPSAATGEFERIRQMVADQGTPIPESMQVGFFSRVWQGRVESMLMQPDTAARVTQISNTTRTAIRQALVGANAERLDIRATARRIRTAIGGKRGERRSITIARTETTRAANAGHEAGAASTGLDLAKRWVATADPRTRDAHRAMIGKPAIPKEALFTVGGVRMRYPGDPAGGAANCVNCRCRVLYVPAGTPYARPMALGDDEDIIAGPTKPITRDIIKKRKGVPFSEAKTTDEAATWAEQHIGGEVDYTGIAPKVANRINNQLYALKVKYGKSYDSIAIRFDMQRDTTFSTGLMYETTNQVQLLINGNLWSPRKARQTEEYAARMEKVGFFFRGSVESAVVHEYGHLLHLSTFLDSDISYERINANWVRSLSKKLSEEEKQDAISKYARLDQHESLAEAFVAYHYLPNRVEKLSALERLLLKKIVSLP